MPRRIEGDWHEGLIPDNVLIHPGAYVETSQSFALCHSELSDAVVIHPGASIHAPTMLDLGARGQLVLGEYAMLNGARILCEGRIEIGAYSLIAWNVVLMDSYRVPIEPDQRRKAIVAGRSKAGEVREIRIGKNVWIGFDSVVLPGVRIGEGSVVGARSVVNIDVPPYCVAAGNPARIIRRLD